MKETIKVEFGLDKNGNDLFYVHKDKDKCFWIQKKDATKEIDTNLIKELLEPTSEGIEYIKSMYNRWYKEFCRG